MNEIKTYPIQMTSEFHKKVQKTAHQNEKTMKDFIQEAIEEKIEKECND